MAIASPLLKRQKSAINISRESDVEQELQLPMAGGDQNVPQPNASADHHTSATPKWYCSGRKTDRGGNRIHQYSWANHLR
jgi:hypothetical protein